MRYILIILTVFPFALFGQGITVSLFDSQTKLPVEFAHVCYETFNHKNKSIIITDNNGKAFIPSENEIYIAITAIGYSTHLDTLKPGQSKLIYLKPQIYNVNEVVITGQLKPVKADKSIYKIDVLTSAQIKEKAATNLAELLSAELNIRLSEDLNLGTGVSMQGLSGEHVKVLIDGVPISGRQAGILDLGQVNLSNADHIEIIEGPMSVIYGSNALAGAINIITKQPNYGKITGKLNGYYESVGIYDFDGNFNFRSNKHTFIFNGGRKYFNGLNTGESNTIGFNPKLQYFGNLNYVFSSNKLTFKFGSQYFNETIKVLSPLQTYILIDTVTNPITNNDSVKVSFGLMNTVQYFYTTRFENKLEFKYQISPNSNFESLFSTSYYNKIKNTSVIDRITLAENIADYTQQDTTEFNNIISRTIYRNSSKNILDFIGGTDISLESASGKRLNSKKYLEDYALFSSLKLFPEKKLNTQIGFRYIYNSKYKAPLVYAFNVKYSPSENQSFRFSYGKGFRTPSLKELYLTFQDINHSVFGNDSLEAEKSNSFSLSGNFKFQSLNTHSFSFDYTLFYNKIFDKIDFIYDRVNPTWAKYYNISNFISKGLEAKVKYNLHPRFTATFGYYYLLRSGISEITKFYSSSDYSIDLNYRNLKYLFNFSVWYKYTDSWYTSRMDIDKSGGESKITEGFVNGYHTLNITLSRPFFNNKLDISIGGKNLFNNTFVSSYGSSGVHSSGSGLTPVGWGRTYVLGISYNFSTF